MTEVFYVAVLRFGDCATFVSNPTVMQRSLDVQQQSQLHAQLNYAQVIVSEDQSFTDRRRSFTDHLL